MATRIAVCGSINFDVVIHVGQYPGKHEKIIATKWHSGLGGSAANTATWLAEHQNYEVVFHGLVGEDAEGEKCRNWLQAAGVNEGGLATVAGAKTSRAWSWISPGEKRIVTWHDPSLLNAEADFPVTPADHLHLASSNEALLHRCLKMHEPQLPTISIELAGRSHQKLRGLADIIFLNADELERTFGVKAAELSPADLKVICPKESSLLVVTEQGYRVHVGGSFGALSVDITRASPEVIVDRTGAGDAFNAGFLSAWLAFQRDEQAKREGALAGSAQSNERVTATMIKRFVHAGHTTALRAMGQQGAARVCST